MPVSNWNVCFAPEQAEGAFVQFRKKQFYLHDKIKAGRAGGTLVGTLLWWLCRWMAAGFDAFRDGAAPSWHDAWRTGYIVDFYTLTVALAFTILYLTFLTILPGQRRNRFQSWLVITLQLLTGAILLICMHDPKWETGSVRIIAPYKAGSTG